MADTADALYRDALAACEQGRIEDGVAILEKARVLAPDQPRIHGLLGQALIHLGRNDEALASFDRALALGSPSAGLHGSRADALVALNRREEAVQGYDRALALKPNSVERLVQSRRRAARSRPPRARPPTAFRAPLRSRPTSRRRTTITAMRWPRSSVMSRRSQASIARSRSSRTMPTPTTIAPTRLTSSAGVPTRWRRSTVRSRSRLTHRAALVTRADHPAQARPRRGRARELRPGACRSAPDDTEALTVRADALIDLERFDEAISACDRVIALDPKGVAAKWNKSLLCLGLGRFKEGWGLYEHRWQGQKGLVPRPYHQPRWNGGAWTDRC